MSTKNFYIFHIAKRHGGVEPVNHCPIDMYKHKEEIQTKLSMMQTNPIPYETNNYTENYIIVTKRDGVC